MITSVAVTAVAATTTGTHTQTIICRPDGRRTVVSNHTYYFVRNDVFALGRNCIAVPNVGVGFTVLRSTAKKQVASAYPEVSYGCAWGVCTPHSVLPRRVSRLRHVVTWLSTSWYRARGRFNVAYDIWFGSLPTIHGHALGAELMIWIGTKSFFLPGVPIVRVDGYRWWYARHTACDPDGCWNYVLFRKVAPTSTIRRLWLLPFFRFAEKHRQIRANWFLKSIDAGFEIWRGGRGLAIRSFSVGLRLAQLAH